MIGKRYGRLTCFHSPIATSGVEHFRGQGQLHVFTTRKWDEALLMELMGMKSKMYTQEATKTWKSIAWNAWRSGNQSQVTPGIRGSSVPGHTHKHTMDTGDGPGKRRTTQGHRR